MKPDVDGWLDLSSAAMTTLECEAILQTLSQEEKGRVRRLFLNNNQLDSVPDSVKLLTNMDTLRLWANHIEQLPDWLGSLTVLEYLGVSNNLLREIPRSIGNLKNLKTFFLNKNRISSLPSSLVKLTKLRG